MQKEKSCGAIVYNKNNEVLIVKHNKGHWDFPKGHVEGNETEKETATREVKEETNIDIIIFGNYRYEIYYNPKENVDKTVVFFLANNINSNTIKQNAEIADIGWFKYDDALNILTYNNSKEIFKKSYKDLSNIKKVV